ncbi:cytochrome P450 [Pilatotrama ljubarskyi]|nr:cytochrome P450 [Pilatotrama ljubarskyi]
MLSFVQGVGALLLSLLWMVVWKAWPILSRPYRAAVRNLPGPPSPSWIYGHLKVVEEEEPAIIEERWATEYGPHFVYKQFLNNDRLWTLDTRALNHILTHSADYQKPEAARRNLAKIIGEGVLFTEVLQAIERHLIMPTTLLQNPALGPTQIRQLTELFVLKALETNAKPTQLRDVWQGQIAREGARAPARIDVFNGLSKMTLDVIGFLVAGHETTSTATTWCLYALTQAPEVQKKLREELFTLETDMPTMEELNSPPYLDAVVRETLRVHAPVPFTFRVATKDDVVPVSEPFVDRHGQVQDNIRISPGTSILIPILALNRSKKLWGEDALEFKPERWENPPDAISSIPGVWGHLLTFLGGPRACIGYRFSLVEMKALVYTLVRAFEFELAVPPEEIRKKASVVQRPFLRSAPEQGTQMPLWVRRYTKE